MCLSVGCLTRGGVDWWFLIRLFDVVFVCGLIWFRFGVVYGMIGVLRVLVLLCNLAVCLAALFVVSWLALFRFGVYLFCYLL